jgi:hypothetical protein
VALVVVAVMRSGVTEFGGLVFRVAVIVIAVAFGWTYITRTGERDRADERRALDQRAADLVGRAVAPGSAVACLEATNTETVEGACERAVFASPESVAAASAYMAARIALLADAHEYTSRRDQSYETAIAGLRRTVAADRYGLASQVLASRDGCTAPDRQSRRDRLPDHPHRARLGMRTVAVYSDADAKALHVRDGRRGGAYRAEPRRARAIWSARRSSRRRGDRRARRSIRATASSRRMPTSPKR